MSDATRNNFERARRIILRDVNRVITDVNNIYKNALTFETSERLQLHLEELVVCKTQYNENVNNFLSTLDSSDASVKTEEEILSERDSFLTSISKSRAIISSKCNQFKGEKRRESLINASEAETSFNQASTPVKMPKIPLPKFEGNIRYFYDFKEMYENLVHNEETIPRIRKMHYLKESLIGDASTVLRNIPVTDAGYQEAWGRVLAKYDNKRVIIHIHLSDLFSLEKIKSDSELQNLLDCFDAPLRGLRSCGEDTNQWTTLLSFWLYSKLDIRTRTDYDNVHLETSRYHNFKNLWKFCETRASAIEARKSEFSPSVSNKVVPKPISSNSSKKVLVASANTNKCCCCKRDSHRLIDCKIFKDKNPRERFEVIKSAHLCRNCFSESHLTVLCDKPPCKLCQNKHHTLLHFDFKPSASSYFPSSNNGKPVTSTNAVKTSPASSPSSVAAPSMQIAAPTTPSVPVDKANNAAAVTSSACLQLSQPTIILPSAVVRFECAGVNGTLRVLLDSCAQSCLITESFVKKKKKLT